MSLPTDRARRALRALLLFAAALSLAACGYGFGTEGESVLEAPAPHVLPTMKIKNVENPTLYPWISHVVRNEIRDEVAARNLAAWVDSGKSDYEMALKVERFTFRSWLTNKDDETMLYSGSMTLEATIYKGDSNAVVWQSGAISYSQNYERVQERVVAADLTRELARRLASRMRQDF